MVCICGHGKDSPCPCR
jgi:hypothetical protein